MSEWLQGLLDNEESFDKEVQKLQAEINSARIELESAVDGDAVDASQMTDFPWEFLTNSGMFFMRLLIPNRART
jgi:hypothetical protein